MKYRAKRPSGIIRAAAISIILLAAGDFSAASDFSAQLDPAAEDALSAAIQKVADEAYQFNLKGLDALDKKDLPAAISFFDQALAVLPQYGDALNNKGVALYRRGDVAGAQRAWEDAVRRDPQYHVSYYNLGLIYLHSKKYSEAVRQFELALDRNKNFAEAMLRIGAAHLQAGKTAAAVDQFAKAYKADPKNQDSWGFYSYGLLLTGDTAAAVSVLLSAGDNAEALAQLGRIEAARKRYAQAAEHLAKAVRLGAQPAAALDLASVQADAGNCKGALATLSEYFAKEARPGVDAWLVAASAARECDGDAKALEYYEKGLRGHPRDPLLIYNAGQIYFALQNHAKAEEMWQSVGEAYQTPQVLYKRAIAARQRGDIAAAERHIRKALSTDEKAEYHDFLGMLLHSQGNDKSAEEHFKKALKIDPGFASAQLNLAVKSKNPADLEKAAAEASKRFASCKGNDCADAALQLSILCYHQKNYAKAVSALESVKDANKDARVYRHLAIYNKELGRNDKAVAALEAGSAKFRNDARMQYELAEAYLAAGYPSKAAKIFTDLLPKWKDGVWRLHYQLGYAYMEMNDLAAAKASFEKSMAAKKDNPAARALLAFVLNRTGQTEQAVGHWEQTAKEDGGNAAIHVNLGLSYESKGQYDKALESYQRAQRLNPSDKAVHINLGNAYKGLGKIPEAFDAYTAGLESNKREEAAYNIFLLSRQRNDNARAERMHALLQKEFPASAYNARVSAEMNLLKGDTAKALAAFEAIRDKDAEDWYTLARIYAARGDKAKAEAALRNVPDGGPLGPQKKAVRARTLFNSGDFRGAYNAYKELVNSPASAMSPEASANMYNMALAAFNGGMHNEAIKAAHDFAKRAQGKERAEICRIAGNSAVAVKNWAEAKNWYGQLAALEPNNAVTQYNLAVAHYNLGEVDDAHNRYQKARELDKKIQNRDIELRYEQSRRGGARPAQRRETASFSQRQHDSLDIWYNRAVDLQNAKKDKEAEGLYRKILESDSAYSLAWNNLGAIYGARGDLELAEAAYIKALRNQPAPETYANLANVYIALEDYAKASDVINQGLARNPKNQMLSGLDRKIKSKLK